MANIYVVIVAVICVIGICGCATPLKTECSECQALEVRVERLESEMETVRLELKIHRQRLDHRWDY